MNTIHQLVHFVLEEQRYALYLSAVQRVVRSVEVTPLPKAPTIVTGVVNVRGEIIPVVNIRKRFLLPERKETRLSDCLIIARTSRRAVALTVDSVSGILEIPEERIVTAQHILPTMRYAESVVKLEDGLILIHDLDKFLSLEEEDALHAAMEEG